MIDLLETTLAISEQEFEDIFQPMSVEEWIGRLVQNQGWTKNSDGSYDVKGDVDLSGKNLKELPVKFRNVTGSFWCDDNQLTSLKGAPEKVGEDFYCSYNQLTTLKGAPERVGGDFYCRSNRLTTLEGAPKEVGRDFSCSHNQLTSLEGAPKEVGRGFYCGFNRIPGKELKKTIKRSYLK